MTPEDKIKVLAEADGWYSLGTNHGCCSTTYAPQGWIYGKDSYSKLREINKDFHYLTSHDAIVPVVVKWCGDDEELWCRLYDALTCGRGSLKAIRYCFESTPEQLANALIKTLGKWKE